MSDDITDEEKPSNLDPFEEAAQNLRRAARLVMTMPDGWNECNRILREVRKERMQSNERANG